MAAIEPGQILVGKYRVDRVLGQGGMGIVVQATHVQLEERVAVKFLLEEYAKHPESSARFLREARAAVKIKSEHVARVVDVGTLENGAPYMVMEFLSGQDLSAALESQGPLSIQDAVEYILQAGEAIAEAHAAGIVHRDLKPANLFLAQRADGSPVIKVLDFGISKVMVAGDSGPDMSLTKTSAMMGSPLYMSPEQMRSARDVDPRSDIWSLGAIMYELLTGSPPFGAESLPELCAKILTDAPRPLSEVRRDTPQALSAAVMRCLEKQRDRRYPTVAEMALAFVPFGPKRSRVSVERISKVMTAAGMSNSQIDAERLATVRPPTSGGTMAAWGQTAPGSAHDRRTTVVATVAGAVLLLGAAAGLFAWNRSRQSPTAEPTALDTPSAATTAVAVSPAAASSEPAAPSIAPAPEPAPVAAVPPAESAAATVDKPAARGGTTPRVPATVKATPAAKAAPAKTSAPTAAKPAPAAPPSRAVIFGDRK